MPSVSRRDHCYGILGLPHNATKDEVRLAYKRLVLKWHPDRHTDGKEDAKEKFIEIHEAYRELMDDHTSRKGSGKKSRSPEKTPSSAGKGSSTSPKSAGGPQKSASSSKKGSANSQKGSGCSEDNSSFSEKGSDRSEKRSGVSEEDSGSSDKTSSSPSSRTSPPPPTPNASSSSHSDDGASTTHKHTSKPPPSPKPTNHPPSSDRQDNPTPRSSSDARVRPSSPKGTSRSPKQGSQRPEKDSSTQIPESPVSTTPSSTKPCNPSSRLPSQNRSDSSRHGIRPLFARFRKKTRTGSFCQDRAQTTPKPQKPARDAANTTADIPKDIHVSSPLRPVMPPRAHSNEWVFPLKLSLEEMFHGTKYTFHITRHLRSNEEKEVRIELEVPAGCQKGTKIRCPRVGHECEDGTVQDIVFVVEELPHDRFSRVQNDLSMDVRLPWVDSLAEEDGELFVKGIDGIEYSSSIPYATEGVTKGHLLIVGAGMPIRRGGKIVGRGDLTVRWEVVVMPTSKTNTLRRGLH